LYFTQNGFPVAVDQAECGIERHPHFHLLAGEGFLER
jgi:hypothetical protein